MPLTNRNSSPQILFNHCHLLSNRLLTSVHYLATYPPPASTSCFYALIRRFEALSEILDLIYYPFYVPILQNINPSLLEQVTATERREFKRSQTAGRGKSEASYFFYSSVAGNALEITASAINGCLKMSDFLFAEVDVGPFFDGGDVRIKYQRVHANNIKVNDKNSLNKAKII